MNKMGKVLLLTGACLNFVIALVHVGIVVGGPPAYIYFGVTDLADLAAQGSPIPAAATLILAIIFAGCGLYALSGAGVLRRLPLLRLGLLFIGGVYVLRGLIVILDLFRLIYGAGYPFRQTAFSAVALITGLVYLMGTTLQWNYLRPDIKPA